MTTWAIVGVVVSLVSLAALTGWQQLQLRNAVRRLEWCEQVLSDMARGCPHAEVRNVGTFGLPEYVCERCGATVDEASVPA